MDSKQKLKDNDIINQLKAKLNDLKTIKGQLEHAYDDKTTNFSQKNEKFLQIRTQLEEVQKIIDEDLNDANAPNIPLYLIENIDQEQFVKICVEERKEQVKQLIQHQEDKYKHLNSLTTQFENSLIENKILPQH